MYYGELENRELVFFLQLHDFSTLATSVCSTRLLCTSIMLLTLGIQLYDNLNVLRLKIRVGAWPLGKHSSTTAFLSCS